jgi:uncharacterized protein YlzI (FlbEa/FlbD family)
MEVWVPSGNVTITKIVVEGKKYVILDFEQEFINSMGQFFFSMQCLTSKNFFSIFFYFFPSVIKY